MHSIFCSSNLLKDVWVLSTFCLLWITLLWTSRPRCLCESLMSVLLVVYLELLDLFSAWKSTKEGRERAKGTSEVSDIKSSLALLSLQSACSLMGQLPWTWPSLPFAVTHFIWPGLITWSGKFSRISRHIQKIIDMKRRKSQRGPGISVAQLSCFIDVTTLREVKWLAPGHASG